MGKSDLTHEFFSKENNEILKVSDFDLSRDELNVLESLIKCNGRQNILLYGAPGTGKTSFTRSLAKKYGRELYTVKVPDDDNHKDRLKAILATVNLADRDKAIVLVDEADEVLNTYKSFFFESKTNKSWINNFLESHDKKVIWITNRSSEVDQSTMRCFSFSMEFRKLGNKRRLKILNHELAKKGLEDYFDEEDLNHLCKTYNVDAGGIVNAISSLKISKRMKQETALKKIRTVLKNHEKATCGKKGANIKEREFSRYSLDGLNTSHNLKEIVSAVKRFNRLQGKDEFRYNHALNILLYGMPGTGKTEFVYYLGHALEKEVILKRCSDIQDKWVGSTEKNIAAAFAEAQEKDSILFFDEADSFFYPRKDAANSWEKDFTNELLTQMESFKGIAMFATNEIEGLDHAAIRRFRFKIEFNPLTPEGNLNFYNSLLMPLLPEEKNLSPSEMKSVRGIKNLTPGDFAVAKDQTLFMEPSEINHQMLIDSLMNEVRHKKGDKVVTGFAA